jgi:long-chain fatty acid transport protein
MARRLRPAPRLAALLPRAAAFGLAAWCSGGTAHASGLATARFGGEHGHPTTDNPTAIYYNPAGIALRPGTRIMLDGSLAGRWASYTRPESAISSEAGTPEDGVDANAGTAKLSNFLVAPFAGASSDFGTKIFSAGVSVYFPFGGQAVWGKNDRYGSGDLASKYPGADDGVQRWYTIDGKIRSMYITGAVAFNIPQIGLSIGASGSAIRSETDSIRARNGDGSDDLVDSFGKLKEGRSWLKASGWQGGFGLGLIWQWQKRLWIGASYTSQPNVVGGMTLKGNLRNAFGMGAPEDTAIEFTQTMPDIVRLGFRFRPTEKVELRLFGDYVRWSVFDKQCVLIASEPERSCNYPGADKALSDPANFGADGDETKGVTQHLPRFWKDAGGVRVGASYWFLPNLEAFAGLGFDSSAVRRATLDPALMDMHKLSFSLGARYQIVRQFAIALTVTDIHYFKTDTKGQNVLNKFQAPTRQADANGVYKQNILLGNVYLDVHF